MKKHIAPSTVILFVSLFAFALAVSCAPTREYLLANKPTLSVRNVELTGVSLATTDIRVNTDIKNNYSFDVPIRRIMVTVVDASGTSVMQTESTNKYTLKKNENNSVPIDFSVQNLSFGKTVVDLFRTKTIKITIKGEAEATTPIGAVTLPFETPYTITLPSISSL